jgi:hypothetical protein
MAIKEKSRIFFYALKMEAKGAVVRLTALVIPTVLAVLGGWFKCKVG